MKKLTTIALVGAALSVLSPNIQAQQTSKTPNSPPVVSVEQKQKRQEELVKEIAKVIDSKIVEAGRTLSYEEQGNFRNDAYNMMGEVYYGKGLGFDETIKYVEQNLKVPPPKETAKVGTLSIVQRLENDKKEQANSQQNFVSFCDDIKDELNDLIDKYYSYHRLLPSAQSNTSERMERIDKQYANIDFCYRQGYTKQQTLDFIENKIKNSLTNTVNSKFPYYIRLERRGIEITETVMNNYESVRKYEQKTPHPSFVGVFNYPLLDKMVAEMNIIMDNKFKDNLRLLSSKKNGEYVYSEEEFNEYFDYMLNYLKENVKAPPIGKDAKPKVMEEYFSPKVYNPEITQNR